MHAIFVDRKSFPAEQQNHLADFFRRFQHEKIFTFADDDKTEFAEILFRMENPVSVPQKNSWEINENFLQINSPEIPPEEISAFDEKIRIACNCDSTVLLTGESGCGKTFTAKMIHENSVRKNKKFSSVNLAEINSPLMGSTLFGTVSGSFTGAENRHGILEESADGTLLLDEIGELNLEQQGKFLNVLDTKKFCKVGDTREHPLLSRLIFATDANLQELVEKRLFKKQLFYRISVLVIEVPPLRKTVEKIEPFAVKFAQNFGKTLSADFIRALEECDWPGNIRQLKNCIERACVSTEKNFLTSAEIISF